MKLCRFVACSLAIIGLASTTTANAETITFETIPLGACTPGSVTEDGITASFSTLAGAFCVDDITNLVGTGVDTAPFSGHGLFNTQGPVGPLVVSFDILMSSVALGFGFSGPDGSLMLQAFLGETNVGETVFPGVLNSAAFFSGVASLSGVSFDTIVLTSENSMGFGIDNIEVTVAPDPTDVPEPSSLLLLGSGVLGVIAKASRRRRKQQAP